MEQDSEPSVLGAGSYRSVSILRLTDEERKMVIEAIKIARMTALGSQEANKLVVHTLRDLHDRFKGASEIWLATSNTTSKSS